MKSTFSNPKPLHAAIIMDGNGRWAAARGWPRTAGHRAGADALRRTVEAAPSLGVSMLTLYAFSSDNWKRPSAEVGALMNLLQTYLHKETSRCVENGVRIGFLGRRDRLSLSICAAIESAENATAGGDRLHVRIAVDYSARDAILDAATRLRAAGEINRENFARALAGGRDGPRAAEVDLLIRTGGEQRLSDFLLWECAYAELYFTPVMWPEFGAADLEAAVSEYYRRERRFGGLALEPAAS
ncbi:MAG: di-trans,poly-cis-decaprenylcistransferase [Bryobacteraceae bacterium]|nr:di-trans,poly-cis-decaprenylcistransferase [Bryobacteraceae bacterium]